MRLLACLRVIASGTEATTKKHRCKNPAREPESRRHKRPDAVAFPATVAFSRPLTRTLKIRARPNVHTDTNKNHRMHTAFIQTQENKHNRPPPPPPTLTHLEEGRVRALVP